MVAMMMMTMATMMMMIMGSYMNHICLRRNILFEFMMVMLRIYDFSMMYAGWDDGVAVTNTRIDMNEYAVDEDDNGLLHVLLYGAVSLMPVGFQADHHHLLRRIHHIQHLHHTLHTHHPHHRLHPHHHLWMP